MTSPTVKDSSSASEPAKVNRATNAGSISALATDCGLRGDDADGRVDDADGRVDDGEDDGIDLCEVVTTK